MFINNRYLQVYIVFHASICMPYLCKIGHTFITLSSIYRSKTPLVSVSRQRTFTVNTRRRLINIKLTTSVLYS